MHILSESELATLLTPADAIAVAQSLVVRGGESAPAWRLPLGSGSFELTAAVDLESGAALARAAVAAPAERTPLALLFAGDPLEPQAVLAAGRLAALAAAGLSAVAARLLAQPGARSLGLIGAGAVAAAHVACLRLALPQLAQVVVYASDHKRLTAFCREQEAEPAGYNREAAEQEVVVTATSSADPVLRGEWLSPGALVCAVGARRPGARELDNTAVARAAVVCCDAKARAAADASDLAEPVAQGVLDWLEVHELAELLESETPPRHGSEDIVLYKGVGIAAVELALARLAVERATGS